MKHSDYHDRRGHELLMKLYLVLVVVSIVIMILYSIKIGIVVFVWSCIEFICEENKSCIPNNNPIAYKNFISRLNKNGTSTMRPSLLCLGDSLTNGTISSNIIPEIPLALASKLGMELPMYGTLFSNPLYIINSGQNMIVSSVLTNNNNNRLSTIINTVYPDYIMICIGTNDISAIYDNHYKQFQTIINPNMKQTDISMELLKNNIYQIYKYIREQYSTKVEIGICTIPPFGENLSSSINILVKEYNTYIQEFVTTEAINDERVTVIPLYENLILHLQQQQEDNDKNKKHKNKVKTNNGLSYNKYYFLLLNRFIYIIYYFIPFLTWNSISTYISHYQLFTDGIHLNDTGRDIWVSLIIKWLLQHNITKAIAIKAR